MTIFRNDDAAYRAWLAANPEGLVVNAEKAPAARYLKLHRAACPHIKAWADRNPTSTTYIKICSLDLGSLEAWARTATGGGVLDPCPTCQPNGAPVRPFQAPEPWAVPPRVDNPATIEELLARFAAAVEQLDRHFAGHPERLADDNAEAELRRWLDGGDAPLDWAGPEVTADEWFFITTLYGQRTRDQQRWLIRHFFPRFVREAGRDIRKLTPDVMRDWVLDQDWMKPRLLRMGSILRERGMTMQEYVEHLRRIDEKATPTDPMPALDAIVRDHRATGWKTLSVFVRDCVGGPMLSHRQPGEERTRTASPPFGDRRGAAPGQALPDPGPEPEAGGPDVLRGRWSRRGLLGVIR
jgi:hypothetical protein